MLSTRLRTKTTASTVSLREGHEVPTERDVCRAISEDAVPWKSMRLLVSGVLLLAYICKPVPVLHLAGSVLNAGPVGFGGAGGFPSPPPAMHGMGFGPGAMWGGMAPQMR